MNDAARIEATVEKYIERIGRVLEQNRLTQTRIDRLKAETKVIKNRAQSRMKSL